MSAYAVGNDLLDLLVTAALEGPPHARGLRVVFAGAVLTFDTDDDGQRLGQMWHDANVASVNYRYGEGANPAPYRFRRVSGIGGAGATLWDVVNGCGCLDYQSCELPGWDSSLARAALIATRDKAVKRLMPDTAAWEWSRDEAARRVAAIRAGVERGRP